MRLDDVDVRCFELCVGQRLTDDSLLRRPVRRSQAVGRAVLVDRRAADHGQHLVTVAACLGQRLQEQHPDTLAPGCAVRRRGEGFTQAVGGESSLLAEFGEDTRGRHHRHSAGERHRALALSQRLNRQVQRHQRRGARRVHRHGGTGQAEAVGDAPRSHTARGAGEQIAAGLLGVGGVRAVAVRDGADEDTGPAAAQRLRVEARAFHDLPGGLQEEPLLRVHGDGLSRRDPEEARVELPGVVQESALVDVAGARPRGVRVVQRVEVPSTVFRQPGDDVLPVEQQLPQVFRGAYAAGEAATGGHDGDGLVTGRAGCRTRAQGGGFRVVAVRTVRAEYAVAQVLCEPQRRRVVEHGRLREGLPGRDAQSVAQVHGGQRVESCLAERPTHLDLMRRGPAEYCRCLGAHLVQHDAQAPAVGGRVEHLLAETVDRFGYRRGRQLHLDGRTGGRGREPVAVTLEGVGGQIDRISASGDRGEDRRPVGGAAAHP